MTGAEKKMHYPVFYHVRVSEKMLVALKKIGSKKVREHLEKLMKEQDVISHRPH